MADTSYRPITPAPNNPPPSSGPGPSSDRHSSGPVSPMGSLPGGGVSHISHSPIGPKPTGSKDTLWGKYAKAGKLSIPGVQRHVLGEGWGETDINLLNKIAEDIPAAKIPTKGTYKYKYIKEKKALLQSMLKLLPKHVTQDKVFKEGEVSNKDLRNINKEFLNKEINRGYDNPKAADRKDILGRNVTREKAYKEEVQFEDEALKELGLKNKIWRNKPFR